jgi:TolB-like protein
VIGRKVAQYKIVEKLGGGGMGVVYRAQDTKLGRDIALKVLRSDSPVSAEDKARFLKEARAAAALNHPNICTVHDVGEDGDLSYISMTYVPGRSLYDIVRRGALDLDRALDIAIQVAGALQAAHHSGIVHRDIKGANIIVGDEGRVTILDFGIAKLVNQATQTGQVQALGTIAYMSPEQASGKVVDHQTDIWSLGVCLYEMITGKLPFKGEHDSAIVYQIVNQDPPPLSQYVPNLSRKVERVITRAMQKKRRTRYKQVVEMVADLKLARRELEEGKSEREPSVAVLPFANMSDDEKQTYFCDGMAEEIINSLTQVKGLRVVARTSSFAYHDAAGDIRDIGRKLGVDTILEGSVQKAGKRLRISTQLIDVGDGYHLWSERYDRDLEDVFAIQDEIACHVVEALKVTLTDNEKRVIEKVPTADMQAYDSYIRAMQYYHEMDHKGFEYARNLFTNAIVCDPNYALAYCGLSDCYAMIASFYDSDRVNIESALTASGKALELDSELAQAHASYGLALTLDERYDEAETEFLLAIDMAPKLFEAYYFYARSCRPQGKLEKAAEMFVKASEMQPENYEAPILAADTFRGLGRSENVTKWFRRGLAAAEMHVEHHPEEARAWYLGAHAHHGLGHENEAFEWNERAMLLAPRDSATLYNAACLFSLLGDKDKCFDCFDRAIENGFSNLAWLENDPDLEPIRSDPRYDDLVKALSG